MAANVSGAISKSNCAAKRTARNNPQMVFGKTFFRFANCSDNSCAQIFFAADPVVDFLRERIVKKSVHREIAARRVRLGIGENHFLRAPAVLVIRLGAERGDLKLLPVSTTMMTPNFLPTGMVLRKSFSTCSGLASVAMSKSCGSRPSKKSRTQPPTQNAAKARLLQPGNNFFGNSPGRIWRHLRFAIYDLRADLQVNSSIVNRISQIYSSPQMLFRCAMPALARSPAGLWGLIQKP